MTSPVSRLDDTLAAARAENRAALVGYLPAGYPSVQGGIDAIVAMVRGGVDVVEIGLPYSDPLMDGPDHPARRRGGAAARHHDGRRPHHGAWRRGDRRADSRHELLEPDRAIWRTPVR